MIHLNLQRTTLFSKQKNGKLLLCCCLNCKYFFFYEIGYLLIICFRLGYKDTEINVALNSSEMNLYINSYIEQFNLNQQNGGDLLEFLDVNKLLDTCITKFSMK